MLQRQRDQAAETAGSGPGVAAPFTHPKGDIDSDEWLGLLESLTGKSVDAWDEGKRKQVYEFSRGMGLKDGEKCAKKLKAQ